MRHDITNLKLIIQYCDDVESDMARFGDDIEDFIGDRSYQRSTAKSIELIGERTKRLSDDVTSRFKEINWHDVCKMRDFMAHQYEEVDLEIQWSTMKSDLPYLKHDPSTQVEEKACLRWVRKPVPEAPVAIRTGQVRCSLRIGRVCGRLERTTHVLRRTRWT